MNNMNIATRKSAQEMGFHDGYYFNTPDRALRGIEEYETAYAEGRRLGPAMFCPWNGG